MNAGTTLEAPRAEGEPVLERLLTWPLARFAFALFEFGLVILVIRSFQLGSPAFLRLAVLAWCGFLVHHFLPTRLRLPFFACLSVAGIVLVIGAVNAAWVVAIGSVLMGIAHLPIAMRGRLALLAVVGIGLAALRAGWVEAAWAPTGTSLTIVGTMFMFRLFVYLYDMHHKSAPTGGWRAASYFFLLPNVCFPLFPIVDYKTFCRTKDELSDRTTTYQIGAAWMLRGCVHLLIYRLFYQNLLIDVSSVDTGLRALQFISTTYLLYLQVSGGFHLAIGMLHMFGFNLPKTNNNYFLSSSFTDLWRRINIYWKDFILKIFFNPAYFKLRKRWGSDSKAMVAATAYAFVATWLLHSYQWFWIRGEFPLLWQDVVFWTIFGTVVCLNMLLEVRRGRRRELKAAKRTWRGDIGLGLRIVGTFWFLVLAWWLWTAESVDDLAAVASKLADITPLQWALVLGAIALYGAVGVMLRHSRLEHRPSDKKLAKDPMWFWRTAVAIVALATGLIVLAEAPQVLSFSPKLAGVVDRLGTSKLNDRDARQLERGYYEDLINTSRFNQELAALYAKRPANWNDASNAMLKTGSFPPFEHRPSTEVMYKGALQATNQWGMRDREYTLEKPQGTYRIAVMGSSHTKGTGVAGEVTWENRIEDRLAEEAPAGLRYELLNFSVGGYGPFSKLAIIEEKVFPFEPDVVLLEGIDGIQWVVNELSHAAEKQIEVPFGPVREIMEKADVTPGLARVVAAQRLKPYDRELLQWMMDEFARLCRERGIATLAVFLPRPEHIEGEADLIREQQEMARKAGFTILEASDAYREMGKPSDLWIAPWDKHPNAEGHRMLADRIHASLRPWLDANAGPASADAR